LQEDLNDSNKLLHKAQQSISALQKEISKINQEQSKFRDANQTMLAMIDQQKPKIIDECYSHMYSLLIFINGPKAK
jgi:prefoldin subunit 5